MRKLPGLFESSSTGEPTRSSPVIALSRAMVTSSREGSGVCGVNSPNCTVLDCPASALRLNECTAACGGCAANSSCSSFNRNFRSAEASAGRIVPLCVRPSASFICKVSDARDNARDAARATRQSIMRAPTNSSDSISSTGVSNSQNSSSANSGSMG